MHVLDNKMSARGWASTLCWQQVTRRPSRVQETSKELICNAAWPREALKFLGNSSQSQPMSQTVGACTFRHRYVTPIAVAFDIERRKDSMIACVALRECCNQG